MSYEAAVDDKIRLYAVLVDQVQRYNSVFWQAPAALFAANLIALGPLSAKPALLLAVAIFNAAFLFAFHRLVFTQRSLIRATKTAEASLRQHFPDFIPTFDAHALPIRAPTALLWTLAFLDFGLATYAVGGLRSAGGIARLGNALLLNAGGLLSGLVGTLFLLFHSWKTTGATTKADQGFLASPWWYRIGVACLALGFLLQIVASFL